MKFVMCPHGQGERESIFRDIIRTSFMDGLLLLVQHKEWLRNQHRFQIIFALRKF